MNIIAETILGLLILAGVAMLVVWLLFREQFDRLRKYLRTWAEQDAKKEAREAKVREQIMKNQQDAEMREAAARERAEAELNDLESGSQS
ncbi:MAG: hypothetical protein JST51_06370 [Armatimonadetes bacterium]|nr:hypothetical protein [Armatimonadota bacterium]